LAARRRLHQRKPAERRTGMNPERRVVLKVLSASILPVEHVAAATQCSSTGVGSASSDYHFVFFTPAEQALLERLMEIIIPSDDRRPGAKAARAPAFADLMISTGPERAKAAWKAGLAAFSAASAVEPLESVLARAAAEEGAPHTETGRFFIDLKRMTID